MTSIPPPGAHGGDARQIAAALGTDPAEMLDLSATVNPVAPDPTPALAAHLAAGATSAYPDPTAATVALADATGVEPSAILLTNGGAEAIALVAAELGGHVVGPEFGLYPRGPGGPRWRSNPHSPTGVLADPDDQAGIWDEAFYPLATGAWTRGDHRRGRVVVGSLTKLLACPGLRIGYVLSADPALSQRIRARQPEWAVNGLACAALPDLLAAVDLPGWAQQVAHHRDALVTDLAGAGFMVVSAAAPWVLVPEAPHLRERLAPRGVVVRDCASFGLPGTMRIAVPDDDGRRRLLTAVRASR